MQQKDISENWKLPLVQKEYVLPFVGTLPPFNFFLEQCIPTTLPTCNINLVLLIHK